MTKALTGSWLVVGVLAAVLGGCAHPGGKTADAVEKTGDYVDDSWITTKVKTDMIAEKGVSAGKITVTTNKGVVTLAGTAATTQEANKAVDVARSVKGVTSVHSNIKVQ